MFEEMDGCLQAAFGSLLIVTSIVTVFWVLAELAMWLN